MTELDGHYFIGWAKGIVGKSFENQIDINFSPCENCLHIDRENYDCKLSCSLRRARENGICSGFDDCHSDRPNQSVEL